MAENRLLVTTLNGDDVMTLSLSNVDSRVCRLLVERERNHKAYRNMFLLRLEEQQNRML